MLDVIARPNKLCLVDLQWTRAVEYYQSADDDDGDEKHHFRRQHVPTSSRYSYYACDEPVITWPAGACWAYITATETLCMTGRKVMSIVRRPRRSRAQRLYPSQNATVYYSGEICYANAFQSVMIKAARDPHSWRRAATSINGTVRRLLHIDQEEANYGTTYSRNVVSYIDEVLYIALVHPNSSVFDCITQQ